MANYVYNRLYVSGKPEILKQFKEQAGAEYTVGYEGVESRPETHAQAIHKTVKEEFSMFNFVKPETPEEMEDYVTGGWYDWNVKNWGTKWDAGEATLMIDTENSLVYGFETAWGAPIEFMNKVALMYPRLRFLLSYEEETGWGGDYVVEGNNVLENSEYDAPDSHAEWIDKDQECPRCGWGDNQSAYDDCPKGEDDE